MGLIQMPALTSTPKKHIEHGIHRASQSRQEKKACNAPHLCQFIPHRSELCIKVESISVFIDQLPYLCFDHV